MRIVSWNVLLREYEQKYNPRSRILNRYPEDQRITLILDFVQKNLEMDTIVCLQECSDTIVNTLQNSLQNTPFDCFVQPTRNEDFLVTIVASKCNFKKEALAHHPTARGYLCLVNNRFRILNCHLVPQRYCQEDVLGFLYNLPTDRITFIAGDFNEQYKYIVPKLAGRYIIPRFGRTYRQREIDFILFDNHFLKSFETKVTRMSVSDHHAISITLL